MFGCGTGGAGQNPPSGITSSRSTFASDIGGTPSGPGDVRVDGAARPHHGHASTAPHDSLRANLRSCVTGSASASAHLDFQPSEVQYASRVSWRCRAMMLSTAKPV